MDEETVVVRKKESLLGRFYSHPDPEALNRRLVVIINTNNSTMSATTS